MFLFPILYIAVAIIFAEAVDTRNLGLMIHRLTDYDSGKHLPLHRHAAASHLSLYCIHVSHAKAQWPYLQIWYFPYLSHVKVLGY